MFSRENPLARTGALGALVLFTEGLGAGHGVSGMYDTHLRDLSSKIDSNIPREAGC